MSMAVNKQYYSWQNIQDMTLNLCSQVEDLNIDYIIALARGGCIPGVTMSHKLDIPMIPIKLSTRDHPESLIPDFAVGENGKDYNFLVVDDINDTGKTYKEIKKVLNKKSIKNVKYAVLIDNEPSDFKVDYYVEKINKDKKPCWIVYPWEV